MKKRIFISRLTLIICVILSFNLFLGAKKVKKKPEPVIPESILDGLEWRNIGPSTV